VLNSYMLGDLAEQLAEILLIIFLKQILIAK